MFELSAQSGFNMIHNNTRYTSVHIIYTLLQTLVIIYNLIIGSAMNKLD